MSKYYDNKYNDVRESIRLLFEKFDNIEIVYYAGGKSKDDLKMYLDIMNNTRSWDINIEDWNNLVQEEDDTRKGYINIPGVKSGVIHSTGETNDFELDEGSESNWYLFKRNKLERMLGFNDKTIKNIQNDSFEILKHLNVNTIKTNPVKGLVIGGVQSGKTTNMASLMAMVGDKPFNMVIILSGTIENLRLQTEARIQELIIGTNRRRTWTKISRPENSTNNYLSQIIDDKEIYYSVVLKNKTRLENLIKWLTNDQNIMKNLSILIIDDEADQGSINTSKDLDTRNTINRLIVNLVHGKDFKGRDLEGSYKSVNYIGYTATPYANILSEAPGGESLYPKDFISILSESDQHFGPKEIFGLELLEEEDSYSDLELNIIREVEELDLIKDIVNNKTYKLPTDLKKSIAYFLSASASLRIHNFNKPVSMLVHISNRVVHHDHIYNLITSWIKYNKEEVLSIAEHVWSNEINEVILDDFIGRVSFNNHTSLIPHDFQEIKEEVKNIIEYISPIQININNNEYIYHEGLHTIVDNGSSNKYAEYDEEFRLNYPTKKEDLKKTPIFLVIGGATLSRGLTLEGLVTSYFLRTPSTADTLTQMGRWFGYRINYELYPRIWMTNKTKNQFRYISTLEYQLRNELIEMKRLGVDYSKVAPKILYSPQYINLVARNKSRDMVPQDYDFTGFSTQTYIFDRDVNVQKRNYEVAKEFVNYLGTPKYLTNKETTSILWENIDFDVIFDKLINKFSFNYRIKSLNSLDALYDWIKKVTREGKLNNFNVILANYIEKVKYKN